LNYFKDKLRPRGVKVQDSYYFPQTPSPVPSVSMPESASSAPLLNYKAYIISTIMSGEASAPGKITGNPEQEGDAPLQDNNQYRKKSCTKDNLKNPGKIIPGARLP
jgi:hypothetical protein